MKLHDRVITDEDLNDKPAGTEGTIVHIYISDEYAEVEFDDTTTGTYPLDFLTLKQ